MIKVRTKDNYEIEKNNTEIRRLKNTGMIY